VKNKKLAKLPRGLRWHSESRFIWFTWYDSQGRQHKKSTETTDPEKALLFKMRFLEQQETRKADGVESADLTSESLASVATLYFDWKLANNSPETVARERRMFKNVLKFLGQQTPVKCIRLPKIRAYQKERRQQISSTMKQPVTARSVNYEMQLLKGVMSYADCWSDTLAVRSRPLREVKSRAGKPNTWLRTPALPNCAGIRLPTRAHVRQGHLALPTVKLRGSSEYDDGSLLFCLVRRPFAAAQIPFHTEITVESQEKSCIGGGRGVCENVRARPGNSAPTQGESERVSDTSVSPLRILIVDDHEAVRSGLRTLLSSSEWIVSGEACDGLEAVEKTRSIRPDLVLMDISMPRMDGIAATRIIRQEMPEAEVIVISQNDPKVAARQARDVNARGYVSESELGQTLIPMIRSLVEEKQAALAERELPLG
jgi:CheY-like chemotaxis protein